jgi:predicted RNA-binding Zn ribbon-like protein
MKPSDEHTNPEPFELSGGALCLDFANTWGNHADPGSDRLLDYEHLLTFARQSGYLAKDPAAALSRVAAGDAESAAAALSLGRELRHVIYRIFSRRAGCRDVPPEDVDRINALLGEALSQRRLEQRDGDFVWSWTDVDGEDLRAPIWPIIESAADLLTSGELVRVCECDADDCNWLFLDHSRSSNRRWCSMKSCGNRAKARRHYYRQRKS